MDTSLERVDEFMHISRRMRRIALESAVGGMAVSLLAMLVAAAGYLHPVGGAFLQELIDFISVMNAVRAGMATKIADGFLRSGRVTSAISLDSITPGSTGGLNCERMNPAA